MKLLIEEKYASTIIDFDRGLVIKWVEAGLDDLVIESLHAENAMFTFPGEIGKAIWKAVSKTAVLIYSYKEEGNAGHDEYD